MFAHSFCCILKVCNYEERSGPEGPGQKQTMKYRWDKKYLYWGVTAFLVIIASISFFLILSRLDGVGSAVSVIADALMPIVYGLCFAYLLIPVLNYMERSLTSAALRIARLRHKTVNRTRLKKWTRFGGIFLTLLLALLFIIALFSMIIPQIAQSLTNLFDSLPTYARNMQAWLSKLLEDNPELLSNVEDLFSRVSTYLEDWARNDLLPQVNDLVKGLTSGVFGVINTLKNILIGIVISVYVMVSKDHFSAQAKRVCYALLSSKRANAVIAATRKTHRTFGGYISGKLLDSLLVGIICFIVMSLFQWPYPLLISVIIGTTNIIPFFGPFIGAIPSAFLILLVDPMTCLYFVIFIIILQQFDGNILEPKILGDTMGMSGFWVIFAILLGGGLFGFAGMLVGVPTFAVIYTFARSWIERRLEEKKLPKKMEAYQDLDHVGPDGTLIRQDGEEIPRPPAPKPKQKPHHHPFRTKREETEQTPQPAEPPKPEDGEEHDEETPGTD